MNNMLVFTILFPLLSFITLSISQGKWSKNTISIVGVGGVSISTFITAYLIYNYYSCNYNNFIFFQELWSWFRIDDLHVTIMFRLDKLSLLMLSIITGVGFLIHIYAIWYMRRSAEYSRFFAYTNLFICNMIILVLSDDLLVMYFGWEGVGLCSYLLIGFYYFNPKNGLEACKAFIMTRFGDICLMCAFFMIYDQYHTLNLDILLKLSAQNLNTNMSAWIAIMLLIGCIAKSAQFPLHTWLVGAMVGPTPVSALIHAATMVTSGIYLINRLNSFFLVTPYVLYAISVIGAITLVIFATSALFQKNIKKILAYSTISQIGYMFLALGEKNWVGSMFHLMTHSVFKALLFLAAGMLIRFCKNEQNIFKMGGSCRSTPIIYFCFLIGGASLSGVPIVTSGFYSKELILLYTFDAHDYFLVLSELIGSFLTAIYTFRMFFTVFHGKHEIVFDIDNKLYKYIPLIILSLFSTVIGVKIQFLLLNIIIYDNYSYHQIFLILISGVLILLGMWMASLFWLNVESKVTSSAFFISRPSDRITRYLVLICHYSWGIDWIYKMFLIKPYLFIVKKLFNYITRAKTIINFFILFNWLGTVLMYIDNSKLNWYVTFITIGVVVVFLIVLMNL